MQLDSIKDLLTPALFSLLVWYIQRQQTRRDKVIEQQRIEDRRSREAAAEILAKEADRRADARRQESITVLKLLRYVGALALVCAKAIRDGHANGDLAASIDSVQICILELDDFMRREATEGYAYRGGDNS